MVERRVEKVCIGDETMYHLDEVLDVETLAMKRAQKILKTYNQETSLKSYGAMHPCAKHHLIQA